MEKSWAEIRVETPSFLAESIVRFLIEEGSPGVIQEEGERLQGQSRERVIGYYRPDRSLRAKKLRIQKFIQALQDAFNSCLVVHWREIKEEKWGEAWKENFKTLHVGDRLVIRPPWERHSPSSHERVVVIDPGMAFGTGSHPSTRMCLEFLEEILSARSPGLSLLDVGTGSGILAIAGFKLGADPIWALDIDPTALRYARKNARANGIRRGIEFRLGSPGSVRRVFDIVVANLLPQELLKLAPSIARRVGAPGFLIVAGLLDSQRDEIIGAFSSMGLKLCRGKKSDGWASLLFQRGAKKNAK